jgi:hypothetical protein
MKSSNPKTLFINFEKCGFQVGKTVLIFSLKQIKAAQFESN